MPARILARFRRIHTDDRGHSLPSPGPQASLSLFRLEKALQSTDVSVRLRPPSHEAEDVRVSIPSERLVMTSHLHNLRRVCIEKGDPVPPDDEIEQGVRNLIGFCETLMKISDKTRK
jgi:hypothetical protein